MDKWRLWPAAHLPRPRAEEALLVLQRDIKAWLGLLVPQLVGDALLRQLLGEIEQLRRRQDLIDARDVRLNATLSL